MAYNSSTIVIESQGLTRTSQLINDGESGSSTYVEEYEIKQMVTDIVVEIGGGDKTQIYEQSTPSDVWTIINTTGKICSPWVCDTAGTEWQGEVIQNDINQIIIKFGSPLAGRAYLN